MGHCGLPVADLNRLPVMTLLVISRRLSAP